MFSILSSALLPQAAVLLQFLTLELLVTCPHRSGQWSPGRWHHLINTLFIVRPSSWSMTAFRAALSIVLEETFMRLFEPSGVFLFSKPLNSLNSPQADSWAAAGPGLKGLDPTCCWRSKTGFGPEPSWTTFSPESPA